MSTTLLELLARRFHEAYERLAPKFGYETRADTKQFDPASQNGKLMVAVCSELEAAIAADRSARDGEAVASCVFLVATGEVYEGEETYTRHEGSPPPLCDFETLYTAPADRGVAEGYVLVPIEPTKEMIDAAWAEGALTDRQAKEHWAAMLEAAPQPTPKADAP